MKYSKSSVLGALSVMALFAGCASGSSDPMDGSGGQGAAPSTSVGTTATTGTGTGTGTTTGSGGPSTTTATTGTSSGEGGGPAAMTDPDGDGPYTYTELDDQIDMVPSTGQAVRIHCAYPTAGPSAGPYPVVVFAHGFQLTPSQYYGYIRRLATFGYVALTADFNPPLGAPSNTANTEELLASLDWAEDSPELAGKVDIAATGAGISGHSLGGKLAVLAASMDPRIKATIVLDPVDGAPGNPLDPNPACDPPTCIDVSAELPIGKPTAFIGQGNNLGQSNDASCAPSEQNFTTFYANTSAPSLAVTVLEGNHMSFIDDRANCGLACFFCAQTTATNETVTALSRAYMVAFYQRYLRNDTSYDTYLTGDEARARYVDTGIIKIESK